MQDLIDTQLLSFYGWWQFSVSLVAFIGLFAIWWHIGKRQKDVGQVWLALSVLCWSVLGAIDIYYANQMQEGLASTYESIDKLLDPENNYQITVSSLQQSFLENSNSYDRQSLRLNGWSSILSLFNSLFILLALPWFKYIPSRLEALIKSKYWYFIIGLPFLFSMLHTISEMVFGDSKSQTNAPDLYFGILTLVFLGFVLWESFIKRRLTSLAILTLVVILFTSVAQIYKVWNPESSFDLTLLSAIFKTSLIMLFFALALSWVKELAQNLIPKAESLYLAFNRQKNEKGKFENLVVVNGLPGTEDRTIALTPMMYELFLKFANRKKEAGDDWLEIKPKNDARSAKTYDIKDHNEIRRLVNALLDGLFGKGNWTKEQHFTPLKDTLFEMSEKRERKIRLKVPAGNISI